jgi:hypothetical protein
MSDKTYLVRFKKTDIASLRVTAATIETHGEHLIFLKSDGKLVALFLAEIVEDWVEL